MATTPTPDPIPQHYRRVTPALVVDGGAKALEFYADVFGATERVRFPGPDGSIVHAEIELGDSVIIVEDASPMMGTSAPPAGGLAGSPTFLFLYVEDVDATIERAVERGATLLSDGSAVRETTAGEEWLVGEILSFHGEAVVLEPDLRKRVAGRAKQLLKELGVSRVTAAAR